MPRDGSGIYSTPPGTHGTPNTTILSANYNSNVDDVAADLNTPRPIVAGGTGATTAAGALTALGAVAKAGDTMTGNLIISATDTTQRQIEVTNTSGQFFALQGNGFCSLTQLAAIPMTFNTNNAEHFRLTGTSIDADVKVAALAGLTVGAGPLGAAFAAAAFGYTGGGTVFGITMRPVTDNATPMYFYNAAGSAVGSITTTAAATAFNTSSDERLKTDLQAFDAGRIVDATDVYSYKWKDVDSSERFYGVMAQQAQAIYPAAVTYLAEQDWYGIDYSKYVPVLLQELKALRARVATLEGAGISGKPA